MSDQKRDREFTNGVHACDFAGARERKAAAGTDDGQQSLGEHAGVDPCLSEDVPADSKASESAPAFRAGFATFVGRPNVGKSTLTNALVGKKIVITSDKPQTTRRVIRGIVHREHGQLILVDTPGMHRPRTLLGERLNDLVQTTLGDVDVICMCIPANEPIGPGDRFIYEQVQRFRSQKRVAIVTKIDLVDRDALFLQLAQVEEMGEWDAIIPVSVDSERQLRELCETLLRLMPESVPLYSAEDLTEERDEDFIAELIRESALRGMSEELPHSIAVMVTDIERDENEKLCVYASICVERDSQKGILIGKGGKKLRSIRLAAAKKIRNALGEAVTLNLHVKVLKKWQKDPKALRKLGF